MRWGGLLLLLVCPHAAAFPSYVRCLDDGETPLRAGVRTCGASNSTKGSAIEPADAADANLTSSAAEYAPGDRITLRFSAPALQPEAGVWFVLRVSDAGSGGALHANRTRFVAPCPSQIASVYPTQQPVEEISYTAPCDAADDIRFTLVYSVCLYGCAPGPTQQPQDLMLVEAVVKRKPGAAKCEPAPAEAPQPREKSICAATQCWDGDCEGVEVAVRSFPINVSRWNAAETKYELLGSVPAYKLVDPRWGAFVHGPTTLRGRNKPGEVPPVYMSADTTDRLYRIDGVQLRDNGTARSKAVAWAVAPASQHHFVDAATGALKGMVISAGNPYGASPGPNGTQEITQGGVYSISPSGCHKLFPSPVDDLRHRGSGEVVNRVTCHDESGVCFMSNWEHYFDGASPFAHCLHWCALDDPSGPTRCTAGGAVPGGPAASVVPGRHCMEPRRGSTNETLYVAPHGILVASAEQRGTAWHLELVLSYTDGASDLDTGASFMRRLLVVADRQGFQGDRTSISTASSVEWGQQLWADTLRGTGYDVRVDHLWKDDLGYVWVSTFGKHNPGEHVLSYPAGDLLYSYKGFENASPFPGPRGLYFNPSGVSVAGGFGQKGSVAVVAVESVIPLPTLQGILFFVDVSALPGNRSA